PETTVARRRARVGSRSGWAAPPGARAGYRSSRLSPRTAVLAVRCLRIVQGHALARAHPAPDDGADEAKQQGRERAERGVARGQRGRGVLDHGRRLRYPGRRRGEPAVPDAEVAAGAEPG